MPLDAVCLSAVKNELSEKIINMRIDKIQQPESDTLLLALRGINGSEKLLICAGGGNARIHLTDGSYANPQSPPMFCMLMRKHISGAKISAVTQPPMERILDIELDSYDAMGIACKKHLILELMGNYSNIILTGEDLIIIDCLRKIGGGLNDVRRILPGLIYRLPENQKKLDITECDFNEILRLFKDANIEKTVDKFLLETFLGFSPLVCREIAFRAYGETDKRIFEAMAEDGGERLLEVLKLVSEKIKNADFQPSLLTDSDNKPKDFSYMPIGQYMGKLKESDLPSFSALLEEFYSKRDRAEKMRQRSQALMKNMKNVRDRTRRKLELQKKELQTTQNREQLRCKADIIMANLHSMKKGMKTLTAYDFYSENGEMCTISLDEAKSPQQNAAKYYKDYAKAKNAEKYLSRHISDGEKELEYLNSVIDEIERAETENDLREIRQELGDTKYLRRQKSGKKEKRIEQKPMHFRSTGGYDIYVGKNNTQNDTLTLKTAFKRDIWLHTQKIHGSHVIISSGGEMPDDKTMEEAAMLAAFYSQGRNGDKIAVDYTLVKNVKKPSGGKPGMVIYTDYKTMFVTPDENLAEKLKI